MKQSLTCGFRGLFIMGKKKGKNIRIRNRGRIKARQSRILRRCINNELKIIGVNIGKKSYTLKLVKLIDLYKEHFESDPIEDMKLNIKPSQDYTLKRGLFNGFVYVIGNIEFGFVKIGYSTNPNKRLSGIQTGCPFKLEILKVYNGNLQLEKALHKKYKEYNTNGEWFRLEGKLKESLNF